jgi:hypothetical protein
MSQVDEWEREKGELRKNPHLKMQRDVWVDFLIRPKVRDMRSDLF